MILKKNRFKPTNTIVVGLVSFSLLTVPLYSTATAEANSSVSRDSYSGIITDTNQFDYVESGSSKDKKYTYSLGTDFIGHLNLTKKDKKDYPDITKSVYEVNDKGDLGKQIVKDSAYKLGELVSTGDYPKGIYLIEFVAKGSSGEKRFIANVFQQKPSKLNFKKYDAINPKGFDIDFETSGKYKLSYEILKGGSDIVSGELSQPRISNKELKHLKDGKYQLNIFMDEEYTQTGEVRQLKNVADFEIKGNTTPSIKLSDYAQNNPSTIYGEALFNDSDVQAKVEDSKGNVVLNVKRKGFVELSVEDFKSLKEGEYLVTFSETTKKGDTDVSKTKFQIQKPFVSITDFGVNPETVKFKTRSESSDLQWVILDKDKAKIAEGTTEQVDGIVLRELDIGDYKVVATEYDSYGNPSSISKPLIITEKGVSGVVKQVPKKTTETKSLDEKVKPLLLWVIGLSAFIGFLKVCQLGYQSLVPTKGKTPEKDKDSDKGNE